jgi:hypothetical protein
MLVSQMLLFFLILGAARAEVNPLSRSLLILNDSGETLALEWVHPYTGETVSYWEGGEGQQITFDSYVNHTFLIRPSNTSSSSPSPSSAGSHCEQGQCQSFPTIIVSEEPTNQIFHVKQGLKVVKEEHHSPKITVTDDKARLQASDIAFNCKLDADIALFKGKSIHIVYEELADCFVKRTAEVLEQKQEELALEATLRKSLADMVENYTCSDSTSTTSTPIRNETWLYKGFAREVGILHDRPASQIHVIHDFISDEECQAIEVAARSTLHRGAVADGKVSTLQSSCCFIFIISVYIHLPLLVRHTHQPPFFRAREAASCPRIARLGKPVSKSTGTRRQTKT